MAKTGIGVRPENRCQGIVKRGPKTGQPGPASKATLTTVDGEIKRYKYCIGHLTAAVGRGKMAERFGFKFGTGTGSPGRPRRPSAAEVLRQMVEDDLEEWITPLRDAIHADRGVVVGNGPHGHLEFVPDHDVRLKAHNMALDRVYGKPRQAMELTGAGGGPISIDVPTDEERAAQVARMLAMTGGLQPPENFEQTSSNGSSNGHHNGDGH